MELKVCKIGSGFGVILPKALLEDVALSEATLLTAENRDGILQMTPVDLEFSRQVEAFLETERAHRRSYRELAK
jgi:antitoxin component of MazEF toxin-antitoxin module